MRKRQLQIIAMTSILVAIGACGGDGDRGTPTPTPVPTPSPTPTPVPTPTPTPSSPASVQRQIRPRDVNPAAAQASFFNVVINPEPSVAAKNRLFLFLSGTDGTALGTERILQLGATRGYHAIGLAYPNDLSVNQECPGVQDVECSSKFRQEILTGQDLSNIVSVDVPNSVIQRLTDLLGYLNRLYPAEGWEQYLSNGTINWSLITVAGHSQGAGHAAYLGKMFNLNGVAMFSGVADLSPSNTTAAWLSRPNVTPASRQYGFGHLRDTNVPFNDQRASWRAIGLDAFGPVTSVDGAAAPYGNSHELSTNAEPAPQTSPNPPARIYHSVPVTDGATPLNAQGVPVFTPVWTYMVFP